MFRLDNDIFTNHNTKPVEQDLQHKINSLSSMAGVVLDIIYLFFALNAQYMLAR